MARSSRPVLTSLAIAGLLPAAVLACNGILGLDDYNRVECTGLRCSDASSGDAGLDGDTGTTSLDSGPGSDPVSWAAWTMPNYVLEAGSPPNQPNLQKAGDDVKDLVTGLTWRSRPENGGALSTNGNALKACADIPGGWRLPKRIELVSLLDYGHSEPFIDGTKFVDFPQAKIWTSSEVRLANVPDGQKYWVVNFGTGAVEQAAGNAAATLCVKASE